MKSDDGYEIRTVAVDPEHKPQVQWIFEACGSGEWTMTQILEELQRRDATSLPRAKRPPRPIATSHIEGILKNRCYVGEVKFEGVWHPGRHEPLITEDMWQRVQTIRASRVRTKEKPQQHPHWR